MVKNFDHKNYPIFFSVHVADILEYVDEEKARTFLMSPEVVMDVSRADEPIFGVAPDVEGLYCSFAYDRGVMGGRLCHSNVKIAFGQYVAGVLNSIGHSAEDTRDYYDLCELNK